MKPEIIDEAGEHTVPHSRYYDKEHAFHPGLTIGYLAVFYLPVVIAASVSYVSIVLEVQALMR